MIEQMEQMNKIYEQETMRLGLSCKEFYLKQYKAELLRFVSNVNYDLFLLVDYEVLCSHISLRMLLYAMGISFNKKFLNFTLNSVELTVAIKVLIDDVDTLRARFFLLIDDDATSISDDFRTYFTQLLNLVDITQLQLPVEDELTGKMNTLGRTLFYWIEGYTTFERLKLETHRLTLKLDEVRAEVNVVLTEWPKKKKFIEKVYKIFWGERLRDKRTELGRAVEELSKAPEISYNDRSEALLNERKRELEALEKECLEIDRQDTEEYIKGLEGDGKESVENYIEKFSSLEAIFSQDKEKNKVQTDPQAKSDYQYYHGFIQCTTIEFVMYMKQNDLDAQTETETEELNKKNIKKITYDYI